MEYQNKGIGKILFSKAKEITERLQYELIVAVSVQNSSQFWEQLGFQSFGKTSDETKDKLLSYGQDCSYMVLDLSEHIF